ncbi:MAG: GHKL domain-containing protein [Oscillospiraceae bacterium]|nr:GHKL domain-containing protein [Oscillospiraceae bacterium]
MMAWYQMLSFFFTNGLRIFWGLYLVKTVLQIPVNTKKTGSISAGAAVFITALSCFLSSQFILLGAEIIILTLVAHYLFTAKTKMCLFLIFFYEIAVALWEFIISAGLGVVFRSESFLDVQSLEYAMAVWIVRLLMLGIVLAAMKAKKSKHRQSPRIVVGVAITGLLGVVTLSGQHTITVSEDQLTTWLIFSVIILFAILFFYLNRQYEIEKTIAQLEKDRNALLERDYQTLRDTYAANAKLFHDFHNHIDILHRYLSKGGTAEAISYLEDLQSPMQAITQTVWVGDEAVDYLINSKIAFAASRQVRVSTNIEFPRHTNIHSVDLVAILGNLLDNALDATENAEESLRFINLTIRRINDMLIIKVENGCSVAPTVADGDLQTSKTDKALHGWGLKSVRTAAEHYDGTVETEYSNHTFRAVVTLSFEAVKA